MTSLEFDFLCACHESVLCQAEMVPLLADHLGVPPEKVFYRWVVSRCKQSGQIADTDWKYFFHGMECDLGNRSDQRFLRIDFGPGGVYDTFSGWGVLQFVMCSQAPWKVFPELRSHLAKETSSLGRGEKPDPIRFSGSFKKMSELCDILDEYTETVPCPTPNPDPPQNLDMPSPEFWDRLVAHRIRLSELGRNLVMGRPDLSNAGKNRIE